jgi:hypothetical protein
MTEPKRLIVSSDLGDFFRGEVMTAQQELQLKMSPLTEYYLVNLLTEFAKRDPLRVTPGAEPLALMYKRAHEATDAERAQLFKNMGDVALYVSGYFTEFIEKSMVDVDYYVSMGGSAYSNLSGMVGQQPHGDTFAELYRQMATHFTELVDVLNHIADRARTNHNHDSDLLRLYDRYARTGSVRIRRLLLARGLLPAAPVPTLYEQ